ncbi:MAG: hypothetical protein WDW36_006097 [Sanguina aurantia]
MLQAVASPLDSLANPATSKAKICTMNTCFDTSKCAAGPVFYVYGGNLTATCSKSTRPKHLWPAQCMLYTIMKEFPTTTDPAQACFFIPGFDTGCTQHSCFDRGDFEAHRVSMEQLLQALPEWHGDVAGHGGQNFLLLDYNFDKEWLGYDAGAAMVMRSAWENHTYRSNFDIQLPPMHQGMITYSPATVSLSDTSHDDAATFIAIGEKALTRPLLLFFSGIVFPAPYFFAFGRNTVVSDLMVLRRPDIVLEAKCAFRWKKGDSQLKLFPHCYDCNWGTRAWPDGSTDYCGSGVTTEMNYTLGITSARFVLAPRGMGSLSYQLIEAIGADCVPVMTGDKAVMPFDGEGRLGRLWEQCIVLVPESDASQIPDLLKAVTPLEYGKRLTACRTLLLDMQTNTLGGIMKQGLCTIVARVARQLLTSLPDTSSASASPDAITSMVTQGLGKAWSTVWANCGSLIM